MHWRKKEEGTKERIIAAKAERDERACHSMQDNSMREKNERRQLALACIKSSTRKVGRNFQIIKREIVLKMQFNRVVQKGACTKLCQKWLTQFRKSVNCVGAAVECEKWKRNCQSAPFKIEITSRLHLAPKFYFDYSSLFIQFVLEKVQNYSGTNFARKGSGSTF